MKRIILFDLGQTLVDYFSRATFRSLLEASIAAASDVLCEAGLPAVYGEELARRVKAESREPSDWCVHPLEERLGRIFNFDPAAIDPAALDSACRAFTAPMIAPGRLYDDTLPALDELRARGHRMGIVSNMPWGTPTAPWLEDLERRGLTPFMEHILFCRDVGWRKPDRRIFEEALRRFDCAPGDCLFVGDRPDWDIRGAREAGMDAVLIDRDGSSNAPEPRIASLREIHDL